MWSEGQTPAKKILKLRVYASDSMKTTTWGHMAVREFLVYLTLVIISVILDLVTFGILGTIGLVTWYFLEIVFYFTKNKRTLRDILVKTLVINEA